MCGCVSSGTSKLADEVGGVGAVGDGAWYAGHNAAVGWFGGVCIGHGDGSA